MSEVRPKQYTLATNDDGLMTRGSQFASLIESLGMVKRTLQDAIRASEERVIVLQSKVAELETASLAHVCELRRLEADNAELRRQLQKKHSHPVVTQEASDHLLTLLTDLVQVLTRWHTRQTRILTIHCTGVITIERGRTPSRLYQNTNYP